MVAKNEDWFWDGPIVRVCLSKGNTRVAGQLYNAWKGGLGVRLDSATPRGLANGDAVMVEIELTSLGRKVALPGALRLRGLGCHEQFLSVSVTRAFAPERVSEEALAHALGELDRKLDGALVPA